MSNTPNQDKLEDLLFNTPGAKLLNFHVTWGPDAHKMTPEERAGAILRSLEGPGILITDIDNYNRHEHE